MMSELYEARDTQAEQMLLLQTRPEIIVVRRAIEEFCKADSDYDQLEVKSMVEYLQLITDTDDWLDQESICIIGTDAGMCMNALQARMAATPMDHGAYYEQMQAAHLLGVVDTVRSYSGYVPHYGPAVNALEVMNGPDPDELDCLIEYLHAS